MEDGTAFIVMELLQGESLEARLRREEKIPAAEASSILRQITRGLREAHDMGIVHRDLKPANIFLASAGDEEIVKILDFGIAKETTKLLVKDDDTSTGMLLGSPHHMSPEQARGGDVDARSDLWSLAVVLFRMLTGHRPFAGNNLGDIVAKICADAIPRPSQVDATMTPEIDRFFERALARNPALRFPSARDLANAFDAAIGKPVEEATGAVRPIRDDSVVVPRVDDTRPASARSALLEPTELTATGTSADPPRPGASDQRGRLRGLLVVGGMALGVALGFVVWRGLEPTGADPGVASSSAAEPAHPSTAAPPASAPEASALGSAAASAPAASASEMGAAGAPSAPSSSAAHRPPPPRRPPAAPGTQKRPNDPFF